MWTAPGKTWLSVRTVKPLERVVTLYSGAWSTVSNGLWLYKYKKQRLFSCYTANYFMQRESPHISIEFSYLERSGGIVLSDWVCSSVFVNNVQHPGQDSRVRSKFSSLHKHCVKKGGGVKLLNLQQAIGGFCFVIWKPCSTSFFLNNYINY